MRRIRTAVVESERGSAGAWRIPRRGAPVCCGDAPLSVKAEVCAGRNLDAAAGPDCCRLEVRECPGLGLGVGTRAGGAWGAAVAMAVVGSDAHCQVMMCGFWEIRTWGTSRRPSRNRKVLFLPWAVWQFQFFCESKQTTTQVLGTRSQQGEGGGQIAYLHPPAACEKAVWKRQAVSREGQGQASRIITFSKRAT